MQKRIWILGAGAAALSIGLIALPGHSNASQESNDSSAAQLERKLADLQARLQEKFDDKQEKYMKLAQARALADSARALTQQREIIQSFDDRQMPDVEDFTVLVGDEGASWLGVETHEVTADKVKELKLPAERGVVLGKIIPDSPASKAGLKENDVITEINGQHVEGTAQFRRMIREIPAGRAVQLTVSRDGRTETINATLGKAEEGRHHIWTQGMPAPGTFAFHMPEVMEIPEIPEIEWNGAMLPGNHPRLGIDAEDLNGELGKFFGAPDGEGILVREVNSGSPAEKAGLKAGDVITSLDGDRIHSIGELREKLSAKADAKDRTVKLGILRNKSSVSLSVELLAPALKEKHKLMHRTNI